MVYLSSSLRSGYPRAIADEEFREIGHLCIILAPIRLVTKALEGESPCTAALYLPLLHQLRDTWKASNFKVPSKLVPFFKEKVAKKDLSPLAQKLALFFLKDLEKIQQRHMAGTAPLLRMCTFRAWMPNNVEKQARLWFSGLLIRMRRARTLLLTQTTAVWLSWPLRAAKAPEEGEDAGEEEAEEGPASRLPLHHLVPSQ